MSAEALMINRCTVERWSPRTAGSDYTLDTTGWASNATDVRCLIQDRTAVEVRTIGGVTVRFNAVGFFPQSADLRPILPSAPEGDRIVLTTPSGGGAYYVRGVTDEAGHRHMKTVYLEKR